MEAPPLPAGQVAVDPVRFRAELARSGLAIKGLAEALGVSRHSMYNLIHSEGAPTLGLAEAAAPRHIPPLGGVPIAS